MPRNATREDCLHLCAIAGNESRSSIHCEKSSFTELLNESHSPSTKPSNVKMLSLAYWKDSSHSASHEKKRYQVLEKEEDLSIVLLSPPPSAARTVLNQKRSYENGEWKLWSSSIEFQDAAIAIRCHLEGSIRTVWFREHSWGKCGSPPN